MKKLGSQLLFLSFCSFCFFCSVKTIEKTESAAQYTLPDESEPHEGTWLQWPHHYQYGKTYSKRLEPTWIQMAKELSESEKVHIIVYNETEEKRIKPLLEKASINLSAVDFYRFPTDDFWVRDNGPIYVRNSKGELLIEDWGFNGWGKKADYKNCNEIPQKIGALQERQVVDLNKIMVNEGGSIESDGNGSLMACKSSILNKNRNPGMSREKAEQIFKQYLGVTNFIWLEGQAGLEITDQHIDGFARFGNKNTIVTMNKEDLLDFDVKASDVDILYAAKNKEGKTYDFIKLPLSQKNVRTTYGKDLGYKGSYCNFYIANTKVIVPIYKDENDAIALELLQKLYPDRKVVGIDFRDVYAQGGMVHCVTQQQPLD